MYALVCVPLNELVGLYPAWPVKVCMPWLSTRIETAMVHGFCGVAQKVFMDLESKICHL